MSGPLIIYLLAVGLFGTLLVVRTLIGLSRTLRRRVDLVQQRTRFSAIRTESPLDDADLVAKQHALEAIAKQTTAVRRLVIPILIAAILLLLTLPFLTAVPAQTVSLLAAALTVLLGVASRNAVENAVSGLLIAASRTFNIGDTVTVGTHYGTVEDIGITHTTVKVWDWRRFVVPNARLLNMDFINHSLYDRFRWTQVPFFVAHGSDLDAVRAMAMGAMEASEYFRDHEPARCWVMGLERDAVELWVVGWSDTPSESWLLACDVRGRIHAGLSEMGVLPHRHEVVTHA